MKVAFPPQAKSQNWIEEKFDMSRTLTVRSIATWGWGIETGGIHYAAARRKKHRARREMTLSIHVTSQRALYGRQKVADV